MIRRLLARLAWRLELRKPGPDPDGITDLTDDEIAAYLRAIGKEPR